MLCQHRHNHIVVQKQQHQHQHQHPYEQEQLLLAKFSTFSGVGGRVGGIVHNESKFHSTC